MTETVEIRRALWALDSIDSDERAAAIDTLTEARYAAAVPQLGQVLADENAGIRFKAATALGIFAEAESVPKLLTALRDDDPFVRVAVIGALLRIGTPALNGLTEALRDENKAVRRAAAKAIGKLNVANQDTAETVHALLVALLDVDADVRRFAAQALGRLNAVGAVPSLGDALADDEPRVRDAVAEALVTLGDQGVKALLGALSDPNPRVGMTAIFALKKMGYDPTKPIQ